MSENLRCYWLIHMHARRSCRCHADLPVATARTDGGMSRDRPLGAAWGQDRRASISAILGSRLCSLPLGIAPLTLLRVDLKEKRMGEGGVS